MKFLILPRSSSQPSAAQSASSGSSSAQVDLSKMQDVSTPSHPHAHPSNVDLASLEAILHPYCSNPANHSESITRVTNQGLHHSTIQTVKQQVIAKKPFDVVILEYDPALDVSAGNTSSSSGSVVPAAAPGSTAEKEQAKRAQKPTAFFQLIFDIMQVSRSTFFVVLTADMRAEEDAQFRWKCFEHEASMVTSYRNLTVLSVALKQIAFIQSAPRPSNSSAFVPPDQIKLYTCPFCFQASLTEDALHKHLPLYHANVRQKTKLICPICDTAQRNICVHVHNYHGPQGRGEVRNEDVIPNKLYPYALVVVRRPSDGRYLMVQEFANSGFWLPGGRAENGESLQEAARRETLEEAGVEITLKGILRFEYHSMEEANPQVQGVTRMRIFFYAEPTAQNAHCKTLPDYESVGAAWVSIDELPNIPLRGSEPLKWFPYVEEGKEIFPLGILKKEGSA